MDDAHFPPPRSRGDAAPQRLEKELPVADGSPASARASVRPAVASVRPARLVPETRAVPSPGNLPGLEIVPPASPWRLLAVVPLGTIVIGGHLYADSRNGPLSGASIFAAASTVFVLAAITIFVYFKQRKINAHPELRSRREVQKRTRRFVTLAGVGLGVSLVAELLGNRLHSGKVAGPVVPTPHFELLGDRVHSDLGFSFTFPKPWARLDIPKEQADVAMEHPNKTRLVMTVMPIDRGGDAGVVLRDVIAQKTKQYESLKVVSWEDDRIGGSPARAVTFRFKAPAEGPLEVQVHLWIVTKESFWFMVNCGTTAPFDKGEALCRQVLASAETK